MASKIDPFVAVTAETVTPHATNPNVYKALYVGGFGDLVIRAVDSTSDVTLTNVQGWVPVQVTYVRATSTATNIVGFN